MKYSGRLGIPLFFGRVEINGKENLPSSGAYILAPNHQNAFLDAIILGSLSKPTVHFLTRSDVFVKPYDRILALLNMMPVYRMRDGFEQLSKNEETFEKCFGILNRGEVVLIFPEANLASPGYALRTLSKGFARLAFQADETLDTELKIIPVGLNYLDHDRPRHKLIINYGKALDISNYKPKNEKASPRALNELKNDLRLSLENLILIPSNDQNYGYRVKVLKSLSEQFSFAELKSRVNKLEHPQGNKWKPWKALIWMLELPNLLPLFVIRFILRKKVKDPQFILSLKFVLGMILFPLWWLAIFIILAILSKGLVAMLFSLMAVLFLFFSASLKKDLVL